MHLSVKALLCQHCCFSWSGESYDLIKEPVYFSIFISFEGGGECNIATASAEGAEHGEWIVGFTVLSFHCASCDLNLD